MTAIRTSKWTAFLLSAFVPGAGQLAASSHTCWAWFAAAGMLAAGSMHLDRWFDRAAWLLPLKPAVGVMFCLLCAEHAKRLLERRSEQGWTKVVASSVSRAQSRGRKLDVQITLHVARSCTELWGLVCDLPRFLTIDPFHDQITIMRDRPQQGVDLVLSHNACGRRFLRFGKIIAWHEGSGYTFSDLSPRGSKHGFPHVFIVQLRPLVLPEERSPLTQLTIKVRGLWTSRLVPVWLGRLWVEIVCREHARLLRKGI